MSSRSRRLTASAVIAVLALDAGSASAAPAPVTLRANISTAGAQPNGPVAGWGSGDVAASSDGRYIVFASAASNLVAGDTNGFKDVSSGTR